jgi:hypothetical protein
MEEKKSYGVVMLFVGVFVVFLVCVMSYSLWRDKQINAFMTTNRAWGIQCDRVSQAAWVVKGGERVNLEMNSLPCTAAGIALKPAMTQEKHGVFLISTASISICHASRVNS